MNCVRYLLDIVFLLNYHLVLVVKYRRQIFDGDISNRAKEIFEYIAQNYNIILEEWGHDKDHVHILFRAHPNTEISKFINAYKSASSRLLKKEFPQIRKKLWKEHFWSQSFCLITTDGAPNEVIKKYIESQGKKGTKKEVKKWQTEHINSEYIPMMSRKTCLPRLSAVSEWCIITGWIERSGSMKRTRQM